MTEHAEWKENWALSISIDFHHASHSSHFLLFGSSSCSSVVNIRCSSFVVVRSEIAFLGYSSPRSIESVISKDLIQLGTLDLIKRIRDITRYLFHLKLLFVGSLKESSQFWKFSLTKLELWKLSFGFFMCWKKKFHSPLFFCFQF